MTRIICRKKMLTLVGLVAVLAVWSLWSAAADAALIRHSSSGDMFANYYVPPVGYGSVGAKLYPCPRPTPPMVGHTYITYPPLAPHESLYAHHRVYWTKHADAPPTRTSVSWRGVGTGAGWFVPARFTLTPRR